MRVLPILVAAAIGAAVSTVAFAQTPAPGPGSNQPPGQATTTQSSEQKLDASGKPMKMKKAKKSSKKMKKEM